jgi:hypothetical protein
VAFQSKRKKDLFFWFARRNVSHLDVACIEIVEPYRQVHIERFPIIECKADRTLQRSAMPFKDQCGICRRVLSLTRLRRCQRCGKLYCRDCMVSDVATGDASRLFCLNCARRTVAPRTVSKYVGLGGYLGFRGAFTNTVKLGFARIDGIIGDNLPIEAFRSEAWWENTPAHVHARAWLEAGWEAREVNLKEGYVVFKKVKDIRTRHSGGVGSTQITKPFTPVRVRIPKPAAPSKTRASRLYGRIRNLERRRSALPTYHGSFKPRPKHEKRLFKPDQKPR